MNALQANKTLTADRLDFKQHNHHYYSLQINLMKCIFFEKGGGGAVYFLIDAFISSFRGPQSLNILVSFMKNLLRGRTNLF